MQNDNIHKLLTSLRNVNQVDSGSWTAYCPIHEASPGTHTNSLSIAAPDDGRILINCHNGCDPKEIVYASGLTWKDCFPPKAESPSSKITAVYDYEDADGILRFQVCRIEPGKDGRAKDFRQRQPDGAGGWTWKTKGLQKFPYRLRELSAERGKPVWIVEGEKQVDYLRSIGLTATCNPGGAGKWLKSYAKHFADRDVIVIPDCDPPNQKTGKIVGAEHAKEVADSLIGIAKSIHVIELPDCQPKWGLDDWLQKGGHTLQELAEICRAAEPWGPESTIVTQVPVGDEAEPEMADPLANDRRILTECGITYVAQHDSGGGIEIFSDVTQKFSMIAASRISGLKYEDLILYGGHRIRQKVKRSADDPGDYSMSEIRSAIASIAAQTSALEEKHGVGVWENNDCLIVVNARKLGVLNGKPELQITSNPVHFGTAYNIGDRCDWVDLQSLQSDIAGVAAEPGKLHIDDIFTVAELFNKWHYLSHDSVFPEILTGMVLATFVQTLWHWRPQIFLTGQAYAGKSTMFKMLARLFGPLCKMSSNSSAAGIRQYIGASSRIVLCDELEKSRYRAEILEMVRASGRGDDSFRGTAGNQQHIAFKLQHIFWCASIESGLTTEADQSRFIVCELKKVDARIDLPSHDELHRLGQKMAAVAICNFRRARALVDYLLENKPKGIHGRICESYAVPIAMYAASVGQSESEALWLYRKALSSISASEDIESDSESLLQEIMLAKVRTKGNAEKSILHMLRDRIASDHTEELEHVGIYIGEDDLLLNRGLILRYLLPSDWKGKRIDTLLSRLPGAKRVKRKFGGTSMRFVSIPKSLVTDVEIENNDDLPFEKQATADPFA